MYVHTHTYIKNIYIYIYHEVAVRREDRPAAGAERGEAPDNNSNDDYYYYYCYHYYYY